MVLQNKCPDLLRFAEHTDLWSHARAGRNFSRLSQKYQKMERKILYTIQLLPQFVIFFRLVAVCRTALQFIDAIESDCQLLPLPFTVFSGAILPQSLKSHFSKQSSCLVLIFGISHPGVTCSPHFHSSPPLLRSSLDLLVKVKGELVCFLSPVPFRFDRQPTTWLCRLFGIELVAQQRVITFINSKNPSLADFNAPYTSMRNRGRQSFSENFSLGEELGETSLSI